MDALKTTYWYSSDWNLIQFIIQSPRIMIIDSSINIFLAFNIFKLHCLNEIGWSKLDDNVAGQVQLNPDNFVSCIWKIDMIYRQTRIKWREWQSVDKWCVVNG